MMVQRLLLWCGAAGIVGAGLACGRSEDLAKPQEGVPVPSAVAKAEPGPFTRIPSPKRIVAIGDLHGDLRATREALRLGGAVDGKDHWAGGDLMVVQTGDQLDRGDDDRAVVDLFDRLAEEAKAAGGAVLALNGNHEVMNLELDLRNVSEGGLRAFAGANVANLSDPRVLKMPEASRSRAAALLPGGPYAKKLAKRGIVALVGGTLFVHGGVSPKHVRYGLDRLNREVAAWMNGESPAAPKLVTSEDGPTWLRRYSAAPDAEDCRVLDEALGLVQAGRMVVGHTVQREGITSGCGQTVWRIDTGMSVAYGGKTEVLQIEGDRVTVLRAEAATPVASR